MIDIFHWRDMKLHGFTLAYVRAQLDAHRWRRPVPRVVMTNNGTPTPEMAKRAGLLYADGRQRDVSFISHLSAAQEHGFDLPAPSCVQVSTPADVPSVEGVVEVFRTRSVGPRDVIDVRGFRVASPARTLLDLAPSLEERELRYLVARIVQRRKVAVGYLVQELEPVQRHPWSHELRQIVAAVARGARSGGEVALMNGLARRGWHCRPNLSVTLKEGGTRAGDLVVPAIRTVIQVESVAHHLASPDAISDATRDMDYARAWYLTIRAWTWRIENEMEALLDEIVATLEERAVELGVALELARGVPDDIWPDTEPVPADATGS